MTPDELAPADGPEPPECEVCFWDGAGLEEYVVTWQHLPATLCPECAASCESCPECESVLARHMADFETKRDRLTGESWSMCFGCASKRRP